MYYVGHKIVKIIFRFLLCDPDGIQVINTRHAFGLTEFALYHCVSQCGGTVPRVSAVPFPHNQDLPRRLFPRVDPERLADFEEAVVPSSSAACANIASTGAISAAIFWVKSY